MRRLLLAFALLVLAQFPVAAGEQAAAWQIVQSAGEVSVLRGGFTPVAVDPKAALPKGAIVTTGANGRVVLRRGAEQIVLDPMSRVVLHDDSDLVTRIRQDAGSVLFQIGKRRAPHFEVDTPYLAAVVKGTVFRVTVSGEAADVAVSEGAVEVATLSRGAVTLVKPGMTAQVRSDGDGEIELLKGGRVTRVVSGDDGGWVGPSMPGGDGGSGSDPSDSGPGTDMPDRSAGSMRDGAGLLRRSSGAGETSSMVSSSQPAGIGHSGAPTQEIGASGVALAGAGENHLANAGTSDAPTLRSGIADGRADIQLGAMQGARPAQVSTKVSHAQLDATGRAVSTAAVATAGKAVAAVRQASRPPLMKATAELPLREFGLCFLALMAFMLVRRISRVMQSAKRLG